MDKIKTWFLKSVSSYLFKLFMAWILPSLGAAAMLLLASFTDKFADYSPFSYGAIFLASFLILRVTQLFFSIYSLNKAKTKRIERLSPIKSDINPSDGIFTKKRIYLEDLCNPFERRIHNKTFIDCELIGPATILLNDNININGFGIVECDFVEVKDEGHTHVGLILSDIMIKNCQIYRVTFLVPTSGTQVFRSALASNQKNYMNWLTK